MGYENILSLTRIQVNANIKQHFHLSGRYCKNCFAILWGNGNIAGERTVIKPTEESHVTMLFKILTKFLMPVMAE
jgi:hypothetical protein